MFDARSLLEQIVNGANRNAAPARNAAPGADAGSPGGGLGDILGDLLGGGNRGASGAPNAQGGNPLEDLLRNLTQGSGAPQTRNVAPGAQAPAGGAGDGGGGLADILGKLQENLGAGGQGGAGGIADILRNVLTQATQGVREGAGRIDDATGASTAARDALGRTTGRTPEDILAQVKDWIANNQLGAGAAAGTLGGLVLGTQTGRGLAMSAAKIGALALIGGLAYKAYQNYQSGRPLITGAHPAEVAPPGSGFEPQALTNQSATTYIRAMIAAANADGRIDDSEKQRIFGALKQGGLEAEAEAFLKHELAMPASIDELAAAVASPEEAAQVYTAARIAIEPDTAGENAFLAALANRLGIDRDLATFIDNEARTTSA